MAELMDIRVATSSGGDAAMVAVHGELSLDSRQCLQDALYGLIDQAASRIVVDLAELTFCDSMGLSTFIEAHHRCTAAGGYLRLAAARPFLPAGHVRGRDTGPGARVHHGAGRLRR